MVFADLKNDLRDLVTTAHAEGKAKGKAEGKVEAVLAVLAARGIPVDVETRARIKACTDVDFLDRWIARAATAAFADEVVGTPPEQPSP